MIKCEGYLVKRHRVAVAFGTEAAPPPRGTKPAPKPRPLSAAVTADSVLTAFLVFQKTTPLVSTPCRCSIIIPVILAHSR
jgi:hypothetical protein